MAPTIVLLKGKKLYDYEGARTKEAMLEFVISIFDDSYKDAEFLNVRDLSILLSDWDKLLNNPSVELGVHYAGAMKQIERDIPENLRIPALVGVVLLLMAVLYFRCCGRGSGAADADVSKKVNAAGSTSVSGGKKREKLE